MMELERRCRGVNQVERGRGDGGREKVWGKVEEEEEIGTWRIERRKRE
jgi:hypothetical protein